MAAKTTRDTESRSLETRNNETKDMERREHESIQSYNMNYRSPLAMPDCVHKEGYSYRFITHRIWNENTDRVETAMRDGWTPVPSSRLPSSLTLDPLGRNPLLQQYIMHNDLIYMERPTEFTKRDKEQFDLANRKSNEALKGVKVDHNVREVRAF